MSKLVSYKHERKHTIEKLLGINNQQTKHEWTSISKHVQLLKEGETVIKDADVFQFSRYYIKIINNHKTYMYASTSHIDGQFLQELNLDRDAGHYKYKAEIAIYEG